MMLFNDFGRIVPSKACRVFSRSGKSFYRLNLTEVTHAMRYSRAIKLGVLSNKVNVSKIKSAHKFLLNEIESDHELKSILNGTAIPFAITLTNLPDDIGKQLEDYLLPLLKYNFEKGNPKALFKAVIQGDNQLANSFGVASETRYDKFLDCVQKSTVAGFYFPTALQEYDIASQRLQLKKLPKISQFDICVSGHLEIIYSLLMYPTLLNHPEAYSPILCASALIHSDERMVPIFKSYGPHCEFWLLSQMMTTKQTQVSEQWSGGLTFYKMIDA